MRREWGRLAALIADANQVEAGTKVSVFATGPEVRPAVLALVAEVYRRGGLPQVVDADEEFDRLAAAHADLDTLRAPAPIELWSMGWADVHVSFRAMAPPAAGADEARVAAQRVGKGVVSTARWRETRWTLVRVPTQGWADLIGADLETLMGEFFAGCLADWPAEAARQRALCAWLGAAAEFRIKSPDTDLAMGIAGRRWIPFAGGANLPDGEVATAPVEDSAAGHIAFPGRFFFAGVAVEDLWLRFERGLVVEAAAAAGLDLVERLLDTDAGSRRIGELGIGAQPAVKTMTGDLLIDEKIQGTAHIALGRAYPECGGANESSLHWDIVKDLRPAGQMLVDGEPLDMDAW